MASLQAAITLFLGGFQVTPQRVPDPLPVVAEAIAEAPAVAEPETKTEVVVKKSPAVQAYEIGRMIGAIEAKVDAIEAKAKDQPAPIITPTVQPQDINQKSQEQTQPTTTMTQSLAKIEVIDPLSGKGRGREYKANDWQVNPDGTMKEGSVAPDDSNSIELGLVCYDANGNDMATPTVTVTATDASQNKTISGTGSVKKIYVEGAEKTVHYYPFHYDFRTVGMHAISFTCEGMSAIVELNAK